MMMVLGSDGVQGRNNPDIPDSLEIDVDKDDTAYFY